MTDKKLFQIDYVIKSSPYILFEFIATQTGLAQWFADEVDLVDNQFFFKWNGSEEVADIIEMSEEEFIRLRWDYQADDEYFEFRVSKNDVTGDTILTISDFAPANEIEDQQRLWDSQVKELLHQVGSAAE